MIHPQMEFCLGGGDGLISVTADVAPREMAEVVKACRAGDRQAAEAINNKVRLSLVGANQPALVNSLIQSRQVNPCSLAPAFFASDSYR